MPDRNDDADTIDQLEQDLHMAATYGSTLLRQNEKLACKLRESVEREANIRGVNADLRRKWASCQDEVQKLQASIDHVQVAHQKALRLARQSAAPSADADVIARDLQTVAALKQVQLDAEGALRKALLERDDARCCLEDADDQLRRLRCDNERLTSELAEMTRTKTSMEKAASAEKSECKGHMIVIEAALSEVSRERDDAVGKLEHMQETLERLHEENGRLCRDLETESTRDAQPIPTSTPCFYSTMEAQLVSRISDANRRTISKTVGDEDESERNDGNVLVEFFFLTCMGLKLDMVQRGLSSSIYSVTNEALYDAMIKEDPELPFYRYHAWIQARLVKLVQKNEHAEQIHRQGAKWSLWNW